MKASAARRAAFQCSLRIDRDGAFSDEVLHSSRVGGLGARERAFVTHLLMGSLRRRGELDHLISRRLRGPVASLDLEVLTCLRLGAYQLRYMSGVAAYAAVSESVELVKRARKRSAAPLVNAVLRSLPERLPPVEAARTSHPEWLVQRWERLFGKRDCEQLLLANLRRPRQFMRIPAPEDSGTVLRRLGAAGIKVRDTGVDRAFELVAGTPRRAAEVAPVRFQDINAQRVANLLQSGSSPVLDVCAAPGGKARQLAESSQVIAGDRHFHRLRRTRQLGDRGIRLVALDAERPLPLRCQFGRVLVDAPCSGTGTLARNPEIKWRLQPGDIADLSRRQAKILDSAMAAVAPGGTLIYATCSLEPEENRDVVKAAMRARPGWTARRVLSTRPGRDRGDGFQAWRARRPDA